MLLQWESTIPRKLAVKLNLIHLFNTTGTWIIGLILTISFLAYFNDKGIIFSFFISCILLLFLLSLYFILTTLKNTKELFGDKTSLTFKFQLDDNSFSYQSVKGSTVLQLSCIKKATYSGDMIIVNLLGGGRFMMLKNDTPKEFIKTITKK